MAEKLMTPVAPCKFAWLNKPDTRWKKAGEFKVNLVFDQDDEFVAKIEAEAKELFKEAFAKWEEDVAAMAPRARKKAEEEPLKYFDPIIEEVDAEGEPTGNLMLNFKCPAEITLRRGPNAGQKKRIKVKFYNSNGKFIKGSAPNVGSGSELVIQYNPKAVVANGKFYYVLYINAVQIVKVVEFGGDAGFADQGDGYTSEGLDEDDTGTSAAGDEEDF